MAGVGSDRAEQRDLVDALGVFDALRGHVGGIDHVLARRQAGRGEVVVDLVGELTVLDRGNRRGHVHHHLRQV